MIVQLDHENLETNRLCPSPTSAVAGGGGGARRLVGLAVLAALLLAGLYLVSRHNYLLFHGLVEMASVTVSASVFLIWWNARRLIGPDAFFLLATAYLAVAGVDLLHLLAYKGMGIFAAGREANLATQLWVAARYFETFGILLFALDIGRGVRPSRVLLGYGIVVAAVVAAILGGWFPACFVEGEGLTGFKIGSEYVICLGLAVAGLLLWRRRRTLDRSVCRLMLAAIVLSIAAELCFMYYVSVYGLSNFVGHVFKLVSQVPVYVALVRAAVLRPQAVLFADLEEAKGRLAELLSARTNELQQFFDLSPDLLCIVDLEGRLLRVNRAWEAQLGRAPTDLPGASFLAYVHPEDADASQLAMARLIVGGQMHSFVNRQRNQAGDYRQIEWRCVVSGGMIHAVGRDITDHTQAAAALREGNRQLVDSHAKLRQAEEWRDSLVHMVVHDMGSPMQEVLTSMQLLDERFADQPTAAGRELLQGAIQGVAQLRRMAVAMIAVSRIEAGKMPVEPRRLAVRELFAVVARQAERADLSIQTRIAAGGEWLHGDAELVKRILANLVDNAGKHARNEALPVLLAAEPQGDRVRLSVHDHGPGIAPEHRQRIFEKFGLLPSGGVALGVSVGLGLAFCKMAVEIQGGDIGVDSEPGHGSSFWFELPAAEPPAAG